MNTSLTFELIVTIVNKGEAQKVVKASTDAGAEGGTIVHGRGTGIHEKASLFGIRIEPEKDIILTLVPAERREAVLRAICQVAELEKPGNGIAFVLCVKGVAGIAHMSC